MDEENNNIKSNIINEPVKEDKMVSDNVSNNVETVLSEVATNEIDNTQIEENNEVEIKDKKPINKKLLFIIIGVLLAIIAAVVIIIIVVNKKSEDSKSFKDPFVSINMDKFEAASTGDSNNTQGLKTTHTGARSIQYLRSALKEDYSSGRITADQYVMEALYSVYDNSRLNSRYRSLVANADIIDDVVKFVGDYGDKLSKDTIIYFYQNVLQVDLNQSGIQNQSNSLSNYSVSLLGSNSGDVHELDKAILSSNKHFIVYYTTEGKNKSSEEYAKGVAKALEYAVESYKKSYGYDYKYEMNAYYTDTGAKNEENKNEKILKNNNIDSSLMKETMPVYIVDFSGSILGKYHDNAYMVEIGRAIGKTYPFLCENFRKAFPECDKLLNGMDNESFKTLINALTSIYISPSFMMDNNATDEELKFIAMHELFHHYQHTHICNNTECNDNEFPSEAAANLAVVENLSVDTIKETVVNGHAYAFSLEIANGVEKTSSGYPSVVFGYNYANIVEGGSKKFFNSQRSQTPLRTLDQESGGKYDKVMQKTVEGIMTLNYKNKYLIPYAYGTILYPPQYADVNYNDNFSINKNINNSAAHFYYISSEQMNSMDADTQLVVKDPERSSNNRERMHVMMFIKAKKDSSYTLFYEQNFDKEFVINPNDFKEYYEIVYAVVNGTSEMYGSYDIIVEKHGTRQKSVKYPEVINTGISDQDLAKAKAIYCKKNESSSPPMTQTSEVLVNYKSGNRISDLYVKEVLDASGIDKNSPTYSLAHTLLDASFNGIEQLFNLYFKDARTIYEKEDLKYSLTIKIPKAYFDNLGDVYNFEGNRKIDILNGLKEEGFTCYLRY